MANNTKNNNPTAKNFKLIIYNRNRCWRERENKQRRNFLNLLEFNFPGGNFDFIRIGELRENKATINVNDSHVHEEFVCIK